MTGRPRVVPNPGEEAKPDKRGKDTLEIARISRFTAEAAAGAYDFKTPREWVEAIDECLADLCKAHRLEMPCSLIDVWGEMTA